METAKEVGEKIKNARLTVSITQAELARRLGVTPQAISQYERGIKKPKIETIERIADALGVNWLQLSCIESTMISCKKDCHPHIVIDGVSHYDEFSTVLSGELTSIPSPLMPNRQPLVNDIYPEGRVYSVTLREKGELGAEATVRFSTYEEARSFFKRVSLHCKTVKEALA